MTDPKEGDFTGLKKATARRLLVGWNHLGRYVEDVSFAEVDADRNPTRFIMTDEVYVLHPDDDVVPQ